MFRRGSANGASRTDTVDPPRLDDADTMLAKELNQISLEERDQALNEIHGVAEIAKEDPDAISMALQHLNVELSKYQRHAVVTTTAIDEASSVAEAEAYREAMEMNPSYVQGPSFQLMFLRAEGLDQPARSAERLVKFFDVKKKLFGAGRLTKDITIDCLDEDDRDMLRSGYMTLLPGRDAAGRAVLFSMVSLSAGKNSLSASRAFFYILMSSLEDEETQRKGIVFIGYNLDRRIVEGDRQRLRYNAQIVDGVPFRMACMHVCYNTSFFGPIISFSMTLLGRRNRIRIRTHFGTHLEVQYAMMTFGIPNFLLPVSGSGEMELEYHLGWIGRRMMQERELSKVSRGTESALVSDTSACSEDSCNEELEQTIPFSKYERVVVPGPMDVIFGRGKLTRQHSGNIRFKQMIDDYREQYESSSKFEKTILAEVIVRNIKEKHGGRFLKQDGAGWLEASFEQARDKTSHAFRNKRLTSVLAKKSNSQAVKQNEKRARDGPSMPSIEELHPMPTLNEGSPVPMFNRRSQSPDKQDHMFKRLDGGSFIDEFSNSCLSPGHFPGTTSFMDGNDWADTTKRSRLL